MAHLLLLFVCLLLLLMLSPHLLDGFDGFGPALAEPLLIVVAQTAGRNGEWNPHLHIIMTSGGLTKGKDPRWRELKYLPFEILHKKWQYYLFGLIKEHVGTEEARSHIDKLWKQYPNGLVAFLDKGEVPE
ncbi:MAG: transposase, partial [Elusimicrobia bacterium]|nr:transposase [Elusimicrobiota bacterium]